MRTSYVTDDKPTTTTTNTGTFTFTEANQSQENEENTAKHYTPKRENEEEAPHKNGWGSFKKKLLK